MTAADPEAGRSVGQTRVRVWRGDLTELAVGAIVNAANDRLWMGGGVAGAIKRRGGPEIERAAVVLGPLAIGEAVATGGGRLAARHVIHAVTMGEDLATDERAIRTATRSALRVAESLDVRSIGFPALGTGVGGFPLDRAAAAMFEETVAHLRAGTRLDEVVFALYDDAAHAAFRAALAAVV